MGHLFSSDGFKPDPGKVRAIQHMPEPEDALTSCETIYRNGNIPGKVIPNMSDLAAPL